MVAEDILNHQLFESEFYLPENAILAPEGIEAPKLILEFVQNIGLEGC